MASRRETQLHRRSALAAELPSECMGAVLWERGRVARAGGWGVRVGSVWTKADKGLVRANGGVVRDRWGWV